MALILFSSGLMGWYYSNRYIVRCNLLKELRRYISNLKSQIRYSGNDLIECFYILTQKSHEPFCSLFFNLSQELAKFEGDDFKTIWERQIRGNLTQKGLYEKDIQKLVELGSELGFLDATNQLQSLQIYLDELDEDIGESQDDIKDKCKVIKSLGIMIGLMIVILMI